MKASSRPAFSMSVDSRTLFEHLSKVSIGSIATYADLTKAIGRDVQNAGRGALETARKALIREYQMVFEVVRSEGLRRMNDVEIVDSSDKDAASIRRRARRTAKKLFCVEYDQLPRDKQVKHNTALSMLGVVSEMASIKGLTKLTKHIEQSGKELPSAKAAMAALMDIS